MLRGKSNCSLYFSTSGDNKPYTKKMFRLREKRIQKVKSNPIYKDSNEEMEGHKVIVSRLSENIAIQEKNNQNTQVRPPTIFRPFYFCWAVNRKNFEDEA